MISGGRPLLPAIDQLPGPGSSHYAGLEQYMELVQRCVRAHAPALCALFPTARSTTGVGKESKTPACKCRCWAKAPEDRPAFPAIIANLR